MKLTLKFRWQVLKGYTYIELLLIICYNIGGSFKLFLNKKRSMSTYEKQRYW